jgi:hypothetical protein
MALTSRASDRGVQHIYFSLPLVLEMNYGKKVGKFKNAKIKVNLYKFKPRTSKCFGLSLSIVFTNVATNDGSIKP